MISRNLGHRAPLLWLVLPFIAGLALGKWAGTPPVAWLLGGAALAAVTAIWASWRAVRGWAPAMVAAMMLTGWASYISHRARLPGWEDLPPREARVALRVDRVFAQSFPNRVSGLATLVRADDHLRELTGQHLYFSLALKKGETAPIRGATIATIGVLETVPRDPPPASFDSYLADSGVNFRLRRGQALAEERAANAYYRFCARAAERFKEILGRGIAEAHPRLAGLLRAMMLGETHELSEEQRTLFMESGTMHLFAISGLNIGVIAGALYVILWWLRLPAWGRFIVSIALLWLFVDITGASPSAVRAFAMAAFLQSALILRQPANPLAALVASAFVVLLVAPLQVFSASFLMSYAIVAALLLLGVPLGDAWLERWTPWRDLPEVTWTWWHRRVAAAWHWGAVSVAVGVASTLVGLLTGLQYFRLLTPGALLTNLALIPAAGFATLFGFASLLCGLVGLGPVATVLNYAAAYLMGIIEWLVRLSVQVPGAFLPAHFTAGWIGPAALAVLLAVMALGYARHWRHRLTGWWAPFAVVTLVLVFAVRFGGT